VHYFLGLFIAIVALIGEFDQHYGYLNQRLFGDVHMK
jgi:hypothetical protein